MALPFCIGEKVLSNYRPFYLRFGDKNISNRKLAYDELCNKIQVDPHWAIDESA
jgi:hypothetical protein